MLTYPLIFSRNLKRRFTNFFWLICNLLTWNHKFSERKKIRRLKRKIVERDTEIMSIMVDLTRFFLSFFSPRGWQKNVGGTYDGLTN